MPETNLQNQRIFESGDWWDQRGPFSALHKMNPVRLQFIRRQLRDHFAGEGDRPFNGLELLDIGCGGGLLAEPLARLGGAVTAIDESAAAVKAARARAASTELRINYLNQSLEAFATKKAGKKFDAVFVLEVFEHVKSPADFMAKAVTMLKKNGILVASTINRSGTAFLVAIGLAEYLLGLLPRGTHRFADFITPAELAETAKAAGLSRLQFCGMRYSPITRQFVLSEDRLKINYLMSGVKER